ncbi:MAG: hypothetical protein E6H09_20020 [Bacteroidetes bacterium]|nr:MAG: hypothetical protein E6H09_20020 [Bacteroidota bacterium]
MATDWYRNKTWDTNTLTDFESRLKRARGTFHKAQYLKIQGLELLDTTDFETQEIGVKLLLRVIREYSMEEMEVIQSHEALGYYYLEIGNFEKAEFHLRIVVERYNNKTRNGTSWMADLKLAEVILKTNQPGKLDEAHNYVSNFPLNGLSFNNQRFYHSELAAILCEKMNKKSEAKEYATKALEYSKITTPDFARHKTLGLVKVTDEQIKRLKKIAGR